MIRDEEREKGEKERGRCEREWKREVDKRGSERVRLMRKILKEREREWRRE